MLSNEAIQQTLNELKKSFGLTGEELKKSITTSTGLNYYDLQAPAKNLYPTLTPLRNSLPRVGRPNGYGTASNWKVINALTGSGYDAMGWVPEGQRSGKMSYTVTDKSAAYATIGEEDDISFEAINSAKGFEDVNATMTMRLLQKMMRKEEIALLGGNKTLALGTPATPATAASGSGATIATATYNVAVVALTLEGFKGASLAGGVPTSQTVTGADGKTFTVKGGSSNKSSTASQAITLGQNLTATVTAKQGAVAYAWYVGTAGNEKLEAITTINSVSLSSLAGTGQALSAITTDNSTNTLAFDGLLTQVIGSGQAYNKTLATGTAGTGTVLTSSGRGSVNEIDDMLQSMWDNWNVSPTKLYVSSQEQKNITNKVMNGASAPLLRYNSEANGKGFSLTAGGMIEAYFNPFAPGGGQKMAVEVHPDVPKGTILAYCDQLPAHFQSNETPNPAEVLVRQDYQRIDWPLQTRARAYGVYAEEVLAVYAPFAMGVITNVANG